MISVCGNCGTLQVIDREYQPCVQCQWNRWWWEGNMAIPMPSVEELAIMYQVPVKYLLPIVVGENPFTLPYPLEFAL